MKKIFFLLFILLLLPLHYSRAASFPAKLNGMILLQAQSRGQLWYLDPVSQQRFYFNDATGLFRIVKTVGLGISNKDFDALNRQSLSRLTGRILIKVQDNGRAYYVRPSSSELIYLGRPNEIFKILAGLAIGVADKTLAPITINKNFPETARASSEAGPKTDEQTIGQESTSTGKETSIATTTPETISTSTTTTSIIACRFLVQYYENKFLYEPIATTTEVDQINFDWGREAPAGLTVVNKFSGRWTGNCYFSAGIYRFTAIFDDAMSVLVDEENIIRSWADNDRKRTFTTDRSLAEGYHDIKVEYYEAYGNAVAQFNWELLE